MSPPQQTITVTTKEGTQVEYVMRGLQDEEVDRWAAFCASVFSYKANPPPPSYFARHYHNDPQRSAALIRVMICDENIVASCRVFQRTISLGSDSSTALAGGIGEVCTDPAHRRRGLSKLLLQDAIQIMTEYKMELSLLHAAPDFFPVYESSGYSCTTSPWSLVTVDPVKLVSTTATTTTTQSTTSTSSHTTIRLAQFPSDTPQLIKLHRAFSESRLAGTIIRSEQYWNEYLSQELGNSLWVMTTNNNQQVVAWLSIRPRGDNRYQVREFGWDRDSDNKQSASDCFGALLGQAMQQQQQPDGCPPKEPIALHLPTFVLNDLGEMDFVDVSSIKEENDLGWMYRPICPLSEAAKEGMPEICKKIPHLVWPSDSF
ncbi:expressed unknown protein [Seminavis robusta]|uniref:N-acetyltransferase domain-containing protein n=1 Tax=Seminavis robusta TaxID=568900 RepID=A0A9N8DUJ7_9STRA|nr:expressed unknown protein [Seminavis robusta]|eukprot:Sro382_g131080.1 n/a (373) ;mRNA; r:35066-36184